MRRAKLNNSEINVIVRDKAIKYIGISKKTEFEVRNKLKSLKGLNITSSIIDEEIECLKELGFIGDTDYVNSYIKQCKKMLNYSIYEIRQKLLQKGLKASIINEGVQLLTDSDYEEQVKKKLFAGKLKSYDVVKQKSYLYRRGFKT